MPKSVLKVSAEFERTVAALEADRRVNRPVPKDFHLANLPRRKYQMAFSTAAAKAGVDILFAGFARTKSKTIGVVFAPSLNPTHLTVTAAGGIVVDFDIDSCRQEGRIPRCVRRLLDDPGIIKVTTDAPTNVFRPAEALGLVVSPVIDTSELLRLRAPDLDLDPETESRVRLPRVQAAVVWPDDTFSSLLSPQTVGDPPLMTRLLHPFSRGLW